MIYSTQPALSPEPAHIVELLRKHHTFIAGAGVAGQGIMALLDALHADYQVVDDHSPLADLDTAAACTALNGNTPPALVITSPGWRPDNELFRAAAQANVPVIGDIEVAWLVDMAEELGPKHFWAAITGTNGKTTTTAMATAMLNTADRRGRVQAVGNIGTSPCHALLTPACGAGLVAEVSSFQLHWAPRFTPDAGVVLNLAEDHLDWHGSFTSYAQDKLRLLGAGQFVVCVDETEVRRAVRTVRDSAAATLNPPTGNAASAPGPDSTAAAPPVSCSAPATSAIAVTSSDPASIPPAADYGFSQWSRTFGIRGGEIIERSVAGEEQPIASAEGISPPGPAGIADALAATALARTWNVAPADIAAALREFQVEKHRGQVVHQDETGVRWVDNSKATNPHAAEAALLGLDQVVWIAGGQLKGAQVEQLVQRVAPHLRAAVLLGQDRHILADAITNYNTQNSTHIPIDVLDDTDPVSAMQHAVAAARRHSRSGDTVVLAPAAASLDMYSGMAQRGELFAQFAATPLRKEEE